MNKIQKRILLAGVGIILLMGLFPPSYFWVNEHGSVINTQDFEQLYMQWFFVGLSTVALMFLCDGKPTALPYSGKPINFSFREWFCHGIEMPPEIKNVHGKTSPLWWQEEWFPWVALVGLYFILSPFSPQTWGFLLAYCVVMATGQAIASEWGKKDNPLNHEDPTSVSPQQEIAGDTTITPQPCTCPQCHKEYEGDVNFCPHCGQRNTAI